MSWYVLAALRGSFWRGIADAAVWSRWFAAASRRSLARGHTVGLHAYEHNPKLWWNWLLRGPEIRADLDNCRDYFEPMVGSPITVFRPPYGQGGLPAYAWAQENGVKHHLVDVDPEDWKHHHDAFNRQWETDPQAHLEHMRTLLQAKIWINALWSGPKDIPFHVSVRTAKFLPQLIEKIVETTQQAGKQPSFVVPPDYVSIN